MNYAIDCSIGEVITQTPPNNLPAEWEVYRYFSVPDLPEIPPGANGIRHIIDWENEAIIGEPIFPPPPDIVGTITKTHEMLQTALETPMPWQGMRFTVTMEKQNLLSAQIGLAAIAKEAGAPFTLEWNETGRECVPWEFENMVVLALSIADYVRPMVNAQRHAEVLLLGAETQEQLEEIMSEYKQVLEDATGQIGEIRHDD